MTPAADPHLTNRERMVREQLLARGLCDERVLQAMRELPRHEFVPPDLRDAAYEDRALPIGLGQTISQPYMVALMLELLDVRPDDRVLEVGAGSGYQAALLGLLAAEVCAIEIVPALAQRAAATLKRLAVPNVEIITGDGTEGHPTGAPYDRIIVAAAAPAIPQPLVDQLLEGGKLLAPVGGRTLQTCLVALKQGGTLRTRQSIDCVFVPLVGKHGWPD